jgi:hypothetical protein
MEVGSLFALHEPDGLRIQPRLAESITVQVDALLGSRTDSTSTTIIYLVADIHARMPACMHVCVHAASMPL